MTQQKNLKKELRTKKLILKASDVALSGYIDFRRNDPCPCGSGKKFKRCCGEAVEKMMFHWNNRGRWPWISPQLQKTLSLVCGLSPGEGEAPPPVSEIEQALDNLTAKVFAKESEEELFNAAFSMMEFFFDMLEEEDCLQELRFSEDVVETFLEDLGEKMEGLAEEPDDEEIEEIFTTEIERLLPSLINREMTEDLVWKLIKALRQEQFDLEKQSAIILAILTCFEGGVNPVWEMIFRLSLSEAEIEDEDEPDYSGGTWPDPSWPVVKSFVPWQEAWNVCGFGSAGVVHEQPDGLLSLTWFQLSLIDGGLTMVFNKEDLTTGGMEALFEGLSPNLPPWQEGPLELTSRYVWGAYAMSLDEGNSWDKNAERCLKVVPQPEGDEKHWLEGLIGAGGLTRPDLVKIIKQNKTPDDLPAGKELMVLTSIRYSVQQVEEIAMVLRGEHPEFILDAEKEGQFFFSWTREYPEGHSNPLARMGGRQILANITIDHNTMLVETKTLSWAGRVMARLKELVGECAAFEDVRWAGGQDLLKVNREE